MLQLLLNLPYLVDKNQWLVDNANDEENAKCIGHDYTTRKKVLIINEGIDSKTRDKNVGPFSILQVHANGTVRIQGSHIIEHSNIRRLMPYLT